VNGTLDWQGSDAEARYHGELAKWWRSESCAQAFERAKRAKRERIEKLKQSVTAKVDKLKRDVEQWKGSEQ
jgi:hypothetical protein